jgi:hypothetical protein
MTHRAESSAESGAEADAKVGNQGWDGGCKIWEAGAKSRRTTLQIKEFKSNLCRASYSILSD